MAVPAAVEDVAAPRPDHRGRRVLAAVTALALVVLVVAGVLRDAPAESQLGTVAALSGVTATGPPPTGLRLAWQEELAHPADDVRFPVEGPHVVASGDLVRVDSRVVDLRDGRLVRLVTPRADAVHAELRSGGVALVDTLTGRVRDRIDLSSDVELAAGATSVARLRGASAFVVGDGASTLLVGDGGRAVELDGEVVRYVDRIEGEPPSLPVRDVAAAGFDGAAVRERDVRLVGADDGRTLATFSGPGERVVDAVGDLVTVATTVAGVGTPGPGVPWTVELVDARTGRVLTTAQLAGSEAPRLLGRFGDGTPVVATRAGRTATIWALSETGRERPRALRGFRIATSSSGEAFASPESPLLRAVGLAGGRVVVLDADEGRVVAVEADGSPAWRVDAPDVAAMGVGGGHVALVPASGERPTRILGVDDGATVASVPAVAEFPFRPDAEPAAVLDGAVGVGPQRFTSLPQLPVDGTMWLDLRTGERIPPDELFDPYVDEDERITSGWTMHGVATDPATGTVRPVVSRNLGRDQLQVLQPDGRFQPVELGLPPTDDVAGYYSEVVGVAAGRLAVVADEFEDPEGGATYVVDLATRDVRRMPRVLGLLLLDDLLLGIEPGRTFSASTVVAVDPASGEEVWSHPLDVPPFGMFGDRSRVDGEVLVGSRPSAALAVDLAGGEALWEHEATEELYGDVVLTRQHAVVTTGAGDVIALDRRDGTERWTVSVDRPVVSVSGAGEHVLVGTVDGLVVHLDDAGREVQRIAVGNESVSAVASLGDTVVAVVGGRIVGLRVDGSGVTRQDEVPLP